MTVWKFPLVDAGRQDITMPQGAEVLCVQMQGNIPCIWALVNPDNPVTIRAFEVKGTGGAFDSNGAAYVGTWQDRGFVWHLFERVQP